jgi:hypothetical protein
MALVLSMYDIGVFMTKSNNSSDSRSFNQTNSLAPSLAAMISASVVKRAVILHSRLVQDTVTSANIAITPVVEHLVTISAAKSAPLKIVSLPKPLV